MLANATLVYTKTRKFYCKVSENSFLEFYNFFESQYQKLATAHVELAERNKQTWYENLGRHTEILQMATQKESIGKFPPQKEITNELLQNNEKCLKNRTYIRGFDDKNNDIGSSDFLTELI